MFSFARRIFQRRILVNLFLGFSSGLPLALYEGTLRMWYSDAGIDIKNIGMLTLVSLPCVLKFVWAPFMDYWTFPFLGRRRCWIIITQILICCVLIVMSFQNPSATPLRLAVMAFVLSFLSSSQDIAIDAYRTEMLPKKEKPLGASMSVNGYRIGMWVSGGLAFIYAAKIGWQQTYLLMVVLMLIGIAATLCGPEPKSTNIKPTNIKDASFNAFRELFKRKNAYWLLTLVITYKLGCEYGTCLLQPFLTRQVNLSLAEIGELAKITGLGSALLGGLLGGYLIERFGYLWTLTVFGIAHTVSNLGYMLLIFAPENHKFIAAGSAMFLENALGGMATAALIGLLMAMCNKRYTAFQFSLVSSLSSIGRVFTGPPASYIANTWGWDVFFISSVVFSIPGLLIIYHLRHHLREMFDDPDN